MFEEPLPSNGNGIHRQVVRDLVSLWLFTKLGKYDINKNAVRGIQMRPFRGVSAPELHMIRNYSSAYFSTVGNNSERSYSQRM